MMCQVLSRCRHPMQRALARTASRSWPCAKACWTNRGSTRALSFDFYAKRGPALILAFTQNKVRVPGVPMESTLLTNLARGSLWCLVVNEDCVCAFSPDSCTETLVYLPAKAAVRLENRRLLDGHVLPGKQVPLSYSRDALAHSVTCGQVAQERDACSSSSSSESSGKHCPLF